MRLGWAVFGNILRILDTKKTEIRPQCFRTKIFNQRLLSVLNYEEQNWTLTEQTGHNLYATQMEI